MALLRSVTTACANLSRGLSYGPKVAVLGAAGGIGQPLSLLLQQNPRVSHLSLYDIFATEGVAADLSHCDTTATISGHVGKEQLGDALDGADHVVIPAGMPRKPGMTRDDLFNTNANIVAELAEAVSRHCPEAFVSVISNPVNSTVPIFKAVLEKAGVYNPKRLAGVTYLDVQRGNTFVSELKGLDPTKTNVTVIGGHAGITILPLLSHLKGVRFTDEERDALMQRIQFGGDEVVKMKAKGIGGSATLSTAFASATFVEGVMAGEAGEDVTMCAYVESNLVPGCEFFASQCKFGENGIEEVLPYGTIDETEQGFFDKMVPDLQNQIQKGFDHINKA